ncbi:hypothetical protein A3K93_05950 [Acinetobacter sp. NCu2D-2]|uniref:hypothetical protein n=1 Tax=Acinetobacter sp. NCu2D-2 TaxID=1608473 RepID=UPI0007CDA651|nr:hypothetical protein [Acinetobacter sp. NCu2D-2]ANF81773.1 hypothetical protein A3K93_05950 [Acinetobacter sp. NCu2D-2]
MRSYHSKKPSLYTFENWTQAHDIYLIEHNHLELDVLAEHLPFGKDEIMARRKALGLVRRMRQLKKLNLYDE